ncbi:hypothetical protein [Paenibacillus rigui]|uniref:hypothetical protein n=1 Tax=Paenibacillus rigui TaxID=554312 RepID=UPI0015C5AE72|nr:hypothetical protein [Paenibacillus rigui]
MGLHEEEAVRKTNASLTEEGQPALSREEFNAANEKLLEDQLQVSEDKVVDYVPGKN